jgi:hypothetical protein
MAPLLFWLDLLQWALSVKQATAGVAIAVNSRIKAADLSLRFPFLRTPGELKVSHLKQFIRDRYDLNDMPLEQIELFVLNCCGDGQVSKNLTHVVVLLVVA